MSAIRYLLLIIAIVIVLLFLIDVHPQLLLNKINQKVSSVVKLNQSENVLNDDSFVFSFISKKNNATLLVNNHRINTDIAVTYEQKARGFMNREKCIDCAILFAYDKKEAISFWMKNVSFDLLLVGAEPREINISAIRNLTTVVLEVKNVGIMKSCNDLSESSLCPTYSFNEPYSIYIEIPYIPGKFDTNSIRKGSLIVLSTQHT
ncbi:MAG: DUF192 domain-containing protein [Candidatus Micrarchaeota archaeon]|nr:DUF192 domain-containing protein [Candidatus Micrarchaeota archaeon]